MPAFNWLYCRDDTPGTGRMRCCRRSRSIVTVTAGGAPEDGLLVPSLERALTPASSSLSGNNGLASVLFSTARYNANVSSRPYDVMSSHCDARPKSVDARNHRYLPLASQTGYIASASPSVI